MRLIDAEEVIEKLEKLYEKHPFKVVGKPDTYTEYNEGYQACCDKAIQIVEKQKTIKSPVPVKTYSDSTLKNMSKPELIDYVRMCEKNTETAYATLEQQARNIEKVLEKIKNRPKEGEQE